MTEGMLQPETRRVLRERVRSLPRIGDVRDRLRRLRGLLEEMGVHCDETAELQDVDAVLIASPRATEALIAARLNDEERHQAYARIVARILVSDLHAPVDARMEYIDGQYVIREEREEDAVVSGLAGALVDGRLDKAPRPLYEDVPKLTFAFTPRTAARSTLGGFHLWSDFWYKRSNMYRRWRSRRDVSSAISLVCIVLDRAPAHVS